MAYNVRVRGLFLGTVEVSDPDDVLTAVYDRWHFTRMAGASVDPVQQNEAPAAPERGATTILTGVR